MHEDGRTFQSVFTVVAHVRPDRVGELGVSLSKVSADPAENEVLPLGRLPGLHFGSLVLFPGDDARRPLLVFESNVDGSPDEHLRRLVQGSGAGVDEIWRNCAGYPNVSDSESRYAWLRSHLVLPGAYHVGTTGRSRDQIGREFQLRSAIEQILDDHRDGLPQTALEIRSAIRSHLDQRLDFAWALAPIPASSNPISRALQLARSSDRTLLPPAAGTVALIALGARRSPLRALLAVIAGAAGAIAWLRWRESTDVADDHPVLDPLLDAIEAAEDRTGVVTNHLASLVDVKPGIGRRTLLRAILLVIDVAARTRYTRGELGGIPSIHFAHWSIVDHGRRLLFLSNYDGSWESYLDDFIEKAASGLSAVWGNTVNFPNCRWLGIPQGSGGARQGPAFKRVARNSQSPTTIHFSAYPALSVSNIQTNTAIREGLVGQMTEEEAQAWLSRL